MIAGLEHETDRKERPHNAGIGNNSIGPGLGILPVEHVRETLMNFF